MKCFINKKYYFLFLILLFAGELPAKSLNLDKTKPEDINCDIIILVHEKRGQKRKAIKKDINNRIERDEKINKQ